MIYYELLIILIQIKKRILLFDTTNMKLEQKEINEFIWNITHSTPDETIEMLNILWITDEYGTLRD